MIQRFIAWTVIAVIVGGVELGAICAAYDGDEDAQGFVCLQVFVGLIAALVWAIATVSK